MRDRKTPFPETAEGREQAEQWLRDNHQEDYIEWGKKIPKFNVVALANGMMAAQRRREYAREREPMRGISPNYRPEDDWSLWELDDE